jgi:hypothetical protein
MNHSKMRHKTLLHINQCVAFELPPACCGLQGTWSFSLRHSISVPYQAHLFILVPFHDVSNFLQRGASYRCLGMEMLSLWALALVYINAFHKFSFAEPFSRLKYFTEPHPCFWVGNKKTRMYTWGSLFILACRQRR